MSKKKENRIPVISFYSGGGFLDMGFEQAGFEIVWTNENNELFAKLHSAGITSWRKSKGNGIRAEIFNSKSIVDITVPSIIQEAFPSGKPEKFGVIGGPPCQDFSVYGNRGGFKGERGKLTIQFFNKILELQPTFFVMENVTGLIKQKSNKEYLIKLLRKVKRTYHIDYKTLNALDFGVPQFRERVFFTGIKKDNVNKDSVKKRKDGHWFTWPVNSKYENAFTKYNWPIADDFGKQLVNSEKIPIELCVESCLVPINDLNKVANAKEYFNLYSDKDKLAKIQEGQTNRPSFKRLHRFRFSPTACYGNNEVHLHPYQHRRISVREALRIQGVPEEYILPPELPLSKKFKMIGNGVPVPMAQAVALAMQFFLKEKLSLNPKQINGHLVKEKRGDRRK
ncbi:DNA cytosine methyltransferase [Pseudobacter ginsenosidimutans]|uniref:DNA (cytosine-5-)-methyltransferase n=1 Tax=Pseudobacter ginsenosidimutans TaxID=661488 RepID=A0A4Q7MU71_9BACT|nr:DNA cytosine methyltransferase [Pseudobacter ginsenosidimutans]QEC41685.1 DNA cytosine methyltransferase [Pseudobacter ginsenosidimutans]RZS71514.1 DNA (cytosine-5)-methyltransferase 1 [Pseudobacter ginsenosidimutans]